VFNVARVRQDADSGVIYWQLKGVKIVNFKINNQILIAYHHVVCTFMCDQMIIFFINYHLFSRKNKT